MNKKQLNTLSASLSKALSPPSRKKIELSARIIDQIRPLPGIVSRQASTESGHNTGPQYLRTTQASLPNPASLPNKERIGSKFRSPAQLPLIRVALMASTEQAESSNPPAKTFLRQRIVRIQHIQDGLTMAEQRVLNYLWENGEKESSSTSRVLTVSQKGVAFAARLSVVSVRANLRSVESKLCIEETASFDVTDQFGRTYRVYSFAAILDRWRRSGYLWARQTRGVELLNGANSFLAEESLAPEDSPRETSAAQVSLAAQLSSTPHDASRSSGQPNRDQPVAAANPVSPPDREHSSAPQFSLPPQDSSANPQSLDSSRTCNSSKESLPPQVSLAPKDSYAPHESYAHSTTCPANQEIFSTSGFFALYRERKQTN